MTYQSISPYDGTLLQTFEEFTGEQRCIRMLIRSSALSRARQGLC